MPIFKPRFRYFVVSLLLSMVAGFAQTVPPDLFNGLHWRMIGPFRGGRAVAVAGVPGDGTTFYFGSVNGGVWKTSDAGVVWTPIFDHQPTGAIGALAVAPSDPKVIYAGTGESDIRSDLSSGDGMYRSDDAGATWVHIGLDDTRQISRVVVDPRDPHVVYVGALGDPYGPSPERGVYRSSDGGAHWTRVLDQGPETGIADLALCAGHPDLLFATTWHTHRPPWTVYGPIDGPGSGLFRSEDGGKTWSRLQGNGLPEGDWGRAGVAVAPDGRRVYAIIAAKKGGLFRSDDGGNTWMLVNDDSRLTSRAWYFGNITVDPQNPDVTYIPNIALYRCDDGGKTISIVRGAPGGDDYHQIWVDPKDSDRMVLGTDQGTTISLDHGRTWSTWYNQPTAQLYHVITDNAFPYVVYGAQQDSGSMAVPSRTDHGRINGRDWRSVGPSESGYVAFDPGDPNIIYISGVYGSVARFDRRTSLSQDITPWPVSLFGTEINERKYRAPWSPVLVTSPADPKALYYGSQVVLKTTDGGSHWETVSPDLTGTSTAAAPAETKGTPSLEEAKQRGYGVISTIAPSPLDRNLIWAGSNTGLIHLTRDGERTWKDVTPPALVPWSDVSVIEPSHFDPAVAYAAVDRSRLKDRAPYLYRTRDYGATWQPISEGIATAAFLRSVREDPATGGLLFAGTELGVYVSFDDGDHWQSLQLNLPPTSVRDLTIHGDDLVIATHGRSFWILDDISALRQAPAAAKAGKNWLFRPAVALRVDNDTFQGTPLPPEEPSAPNPPNGAILDYFLAAPAINVELQILDAQGKLVRSFSSEEPPAPKPEHVPIAERWFPKPQVVSKSAGMHRFVWDLAWRSSGSQSSGEEGPASPRGPKVVPGNYQVRLTVDGTTLTEPLQVVMDPRATASPEVLAEQFRFAQQIYGELVVARHSLTEIASVQKQMAELEKKAAPQLKMALEAAASALKKILHDDQQRGAGLANAYQNLASALRVVEGGDRAIPAQVLALHDEASREAQSRMQEWISWQHSSLPQLNQRLRGAKLPTVVVHDDAQAH